MNDSIFVFFLLTKQVINIKTFHLLINLYKEHLFLFLSRNSSTNVYLCIFAIKRNDFFSVLSTFIFKRHKIRQPSSLLDKNSRRNHHKDVVISEGDVRAR